MVIKDFNQIETNGVKGILLDLDNTIYQYSPCHEKALWACCEEFQKIFTDKQSEYFIEKYQEARSKINKTLYGQAASHSRLLYFQLAFESIIGRTEYELSLLFEQIYWDAFMDNMTAREDALDFIKKSSEKRIKICILTDLTTQIQFRKIIKLEIGEYIDFMVTSEECGVEKPSDKMFELALNKLSLTNNEVIMIGDSWEKDIEGAKKMEIKYFNIEQ